MLGCFPAGGSARQRPGHASDEAGFRLAAGWLAGLHQSNHITPDSLVIGQEQASSLAAGPATEIGCMASADAWAGTVVSAAMLWAHLSDSTAVVSRTHARNCAVVMVTAPKKSTSKPERPVVASRSASACIGGAPATTSGRSARPAHGRQVVPGRGCPSKQMTRLSTRAHSRWPFSRPLAAR